MPIYQMSMGEARCEAACPSMFLPLLMIGGKCSRLKAKAAHFPEHLPRANAHVGGQNLLTSEGIYHEHQPLSQNKNYERRLVTRNTCPGRFIVPSLNEA
jgi:hypothetical protein